MLALGLLPAGAADAATKKPRADLVVGSVANPPSTATPGASLPSGDTTRNRGRATAGASTTRYYLSLDSKVNKGDMRVAQHRVPRLRPGRSFSQRATLKVPTFANQGTYRVLVCADRGAKKLRESNERNNCRSAKRRVRITRAAVLAPGAPGVGPSPALVISPAEQAFGAAVGRSHGPVQFTITNGGKAASGALLTEVTGTDAAMFKVSSDSCAGKTLAAGASCTLSVTFSPTSLGAKTAALQVSGAPGGVAVANLKGTGQTAAALGVAPPAHVFPATAIGKSSAPVTFTVTNNGQAVSGGVAAALSGTDAAHFKISQNNCAGVTLNGGATCTVLVTFSPTGTGGKAASLGVSASPGGTATSALSGTGLTPASVTVSPTARDFGTSPSGSQGALHTFTVTNSGQERSGPIATTIAGADASQFVITNNTCTGATLDTTTPSCTLNISFMPTGAAGNRQASLQVSANPGTPTGSPATSVLTGIAGAPALTISPTSRDFGLINVGSSGSFTFTVTNTGLQQSGPLSTTIAGTDAGQFSIPAAGNACDGVQLAASTGSCTLQVTFSPTSAGPKSATLQVSGAPGGTATASLTGQGNPVIAVLTLTPAEQPFGTVAPGSSVTHNFTVTNTGQAPSSAITVSKSGTNAADFTIGTAPTNPCQGATLAPTATCTIPVTFSPAAGGTPSRSATLQVTATQGGTDTSALTGTRG